jgi:ZIP family zinc transporter
MSDDRPRGLRLGPYVSDGLWGAVVGACGIAALVGYLAAGAISRQVRLVDGRDPGGLLAMLTNSLTPFAFERGKETAGAATVLSSRLSIGST